MTGNAQADAQMSSVAKSALGMQKAKTTGLFDEQSPDRLAPLVDMPEISTGTRHQLLSGQNR